MKKTLIVAFSTLLSVLFSVSAFAAVPAPSTQTSLLNPLLSTAKNLIVDCRVDRQDNPIYNGELVSVTSPEAVEPNTLFDVSIKIKNTSNVPWFSSTSGCQVANATFLGTAKAQDRDSLFQAPGIFGDTKWYSSNRIIMKTPRVNPGEIAEFSFKSHAPTTPGMYREYFQPVIENVAWVTGLSDAKFDVTVGAPEDKKGVLKYTKDIPLSMNLLDPKFEGEKKIIVDISSQRMSVMLGNVEIKNFPVSTGTASHPTPYGTTKILLKQQVRVAGGWPHYIMPKFMMFKKGGYGIHALPSLSFDNGYYWTEALNHIGTRRSHGCIRLLPADANFMFDFTDIGTTVQVVP